jgi:hypothetical protein
MRKPSDRKKKDLSISTSKTPTTSKEETTLVLPEADTTKDKHMVVTNSNNMSITVTNNHQWEDIKWRLLT